MDPHLTDSLLSMVDPAWFEVDAERRVVRWSPGAERITGFAAAEVVGLPCVVGVRCPVCLQGCGVFRHGDVREVPITLHRKDGGTVTVRKSGHAFRGPDGAITGAVEVVREVEGASPEAGAPSADGLLGALGRLWLALDADFRVVGASPALAARLGVPLAELLGTPAGRWLGEELFGPKAEFRAALAAGQRREGWRSALHGPDGAPVAAVSVSAGAADRPEGRRCFVILRPDGVEELRPAPEGLFEGMVARSPAMQRVVRLLDLLRDNDATVLITGESGTGKELVARALHARSRRAQRPFVAVNCGALPPDLLESELFGHVRGAFTGAVRDRPGRFELAEGGTLFLDEIGDLPFPLQVKLLRALQEHTFERVGEGRPRRADVRVVAATHVDLPRAVAERRFREDLYYRLRVVPIELPPLRERREDLEALIEVLLHRIGMRRGRALRLAPTAMRRLLAHDWPGNVRELENALEYATAVCEGQTVHESDLPAEVGGRLTPAPTSTNPDRTSPPRLSEPDDEAEIAQLRAALLATRWRKSEAAARLGISRATLWRKLRMYRLE